MTAQNKVKNGMVRWSLAHAYEPSSFGMSNTNKIIISLDTFINSIFGVSAPVIEGQS
jgi:hypothetical protein